MQLFGAPWPVMSGPAKSVLVDLLIHGPTSRAELARRAGLSAATLTRITKSLVDANLVTENDAERGAGTGRPSLPLGVNPDLVHVLGINLTASSMTTVTLDLHGRILTEMVDPLDDPDREAVAAALADVVQRHRFVDPLIRGVGVSLAGPVAPFRRVVPISPFLGWEAVELGRQLEGATGLATAVENDVRALTAAEHWFGAAAGVDNVVLVTIGAGVGAGMVVNGRLLEGLDGHSGQIGHLPITDSGPLCERGHRGCARSYLAESLIRRQVAQATGLPVPTYAEVLDFAAAGQPVVQRVVADAGFALGRLIGTLAAVTGPELVIVSGEGVGLLDTVLPQVHEAAAAAQHWTIAPVPITVLPFATSEWARGAAVIALRRQLESADDEG